MVLALASGAGAEVYTWVDADGVTHIVDDPAALPDAARREALSGRDGLRELWGGDRVDPRQPPAPAPEPAGGVEADRTARLLRGTMGRRSARPSERARHQRLTGQAEQRGARGVQIVAPSSIMA